MGSVASGVSACGCSGGSKGSSGSSQTPVSSRSGAESAKLSGSAGEAAGAGEAASAGASASSGEATGAGEGTCKSSGAASWGEPETGAIGTIGWSSVVSSLGSAGRIPVDSDAMDRSSERRSAAPGEAAAACGEDALGVTGAAGPTVGR